MASPSDPDVYLASQSPRRRELLEQIGVRYKLVSVDVPEERGLDENPQAYVKRLSLSKAKAGLAAITDYPLQKPVLGADTIVVLGQQVFEKPKDQSTAIDMLLSLSGSTHEVMTSISLCSQQRQRTLLNISEVTFREITPEEAKRYWQTGEPADKAGAYAIQGLGAVFVEKVKGSYSSVVGLPLLDLAELLDEFHVPIWSSS